MPQAQVNGIAIEYEVQGDGPVLLLVYGYGGSKERWRRKFLDQLAADFRLITLDNRGTGRSGKPDAPYTMADMARDALGLLDHLAIGRCHLLGLSMGGVIAQEIVAQAPQRIDRLVLADTHAGVATAVQSPPWVREAFAIDPALSPEAQSLKSRPAVYSERFAEEEAAFLDAEFERAQRDPTPLATFQRHGEAVAGWSGFERLAAIAQPTLVIHGSADVLILPENGRMLAEAIPSGRLELVPGSGHIPMTEQPDTVARLVRDFLLAQS